MSLEKEFNRLQMYENIQEPPKKVRFSKDLQYFEVEYSNDHRYNHYFYDKKRFEHRIQLFEEIYVKTFKLNMNTTVCITKNIKPCGL